MADGAVIALAPPVFECNDLLVLALFDNFSRDFRSGDERLAVCHFFSIGKHQHVAECRGLAGIDFQKIDVDRVTFSDAKLPATGSDDCVSHNLSAGEKAAQNPTDASVWQTEKGGYTARAAACAILSASSFGRATSHASSAEDSEHYMHACHQLRRSFVAVADKLSIKSFIALRRDVPGEIARHRTFHQLGPEALVAEDLTRALYCVPKGVA
jgi:hypothetical protein